MEPVYVFRCSHIPVTQVDHGDANSIHQSRTAEWRARSGKIPVQGVLPEVKVQGANQVIYLYIREVKDMLRLLGIEYSGAWHHVLTRSAGWRWISRFDDQRRCFLSQLSDTRVRFKATRVDAKAYRLKLCHSSEGLTGSSGAQDE